MEFTLQEIGYFIMFFGLFLFLLLAFIPKKHTLTRAALTTTIGSIGSPIMMPNHYLSKRGKIIKYSIYLFFYLGAILILLTKLWKNIIINT